MSSEQPKDPEEIIHFIGHTEYTDDWARFRHVVAQKIGRELDLRAQNPSSVEQAFTIKSAKTYLGYQEFWEELIATEDIGSFDKDNQWQGLSIPELTDRLEHAVKADDYDREQVSQWAQFAEAATLEIDHTDTKNIQIVVFQHVAIQEIFNSKFDKSTYAYLVVYPSGKREISFPTAMCHTVDAMALLQEATLIRTLGKLYHSKDKTKPKLVSVGEDQLKLRSFKVPPTSDEQLLATIGKRGTTIVDRLIQAGLSLRDKTKGIKGEHIDAFRAISDENWAVSYALACHRGLGHVVNSKINLPPVPMSPRP